MLNTVKLEEVKISLFGKSGRHFHSFWNELYKNTLFIEKNFHSLEKNGVKKKKQFIDVIRLVYTPETNCNISDQLQNKENYYLKPQICVESDTYEIKK